MTINNNPLRGYELALATLEWIRKHPEHWNQSEWHCGTSHCFAGVAQILALGQDPSWSEYECRNSLYQEMKNVPGWEDTGLRPYENDQYFAADTQEQARYLLGISCEFSDTLFDGGNSFQQLEAYVLSNKEKFSFVKAEPQQE